MKNKLFFGFILVILVLSNVVLKVNSDNYKSNTVKHIGSIYAFYDSVLIRERKSFLDFQMAFKRVGSSLEENYPDLYAELKDQEKVIVFFNEKVCTCSVVKYVMDLDYIENDFDEDVILLGNFSSDSVFNQYMLNIPDMYHEFNITHPDLTSIFSDNLVVFIANNQLTPRLLHLPESDTAIWKYYFDVIISNDLHGSSST